MLSSEKFLKISRILAGVFVVVCIGTLAVYLFQAKQVNTKGYSKSGIKVWTVEYPYKAKITKYGYETDAKNSCITLKYEYKDNSGTYKLDMKRHIKGSELPDIINLRPANVKSFRVIERG